MSIGGIMDMEWVSKRQVYCGARCDFQGGIQVIGETAVAMFTIAIALHTFISIWQNRRLSYRPLFWVTYSACCWAYVLIFVLVGWASHKNSVEEEGFFAPAPFCEWCRVLGLNYSLTAAIGCWVNSRYEQERFGEYIWSVSFYFLYRSIL